MTAPETAVLIAYFFVLSILGIYGWHRYYLVYLYMKNRGRAPEPLPAADGPRMVDTASETGHEEWRGAAPADGAGERSSPHSLLASQGA